MKKRLLIMLILTTIFINLICCTKSESVDTMKEKTFLPYTGEECENDTKNNIPFMVMVENSTASRPQSGLSQADIIYETSAEGGIPRFMALFHSQSPDVIGPVRSVRPYFITISRENSLPFAHCGGSADALNEIKSDASIMSINEISKENYFWRDSSRKAPHNLYTSADKIRSYIGNTWDTNSKQFVNFNNEYYNSNSLESCSNISLNINKLYNTSYTYDDNLYTKYMDGKEAIDMNNNEPLRFSNIIIQKTNIVLGEDGLHLDINLIGKGEGLLLTKGKIINIKWEKFSELSKTTLYDMNGNEIPLSTGKTIWHIIDKNTNIQFK